MERDSRSYSEKYGETATQKDRKKSKEKASSRTADDRSNKLSLSVVETPQSIRIETGIISAYIPRQGDFLIDSLFREGVKVGEKARLVCNTQSEPVLENTSQIDFTNYTGRLTSATVERIGKVRTLVKLEGTHRSETGREWLPFVVRLYFYAGSEQIKIVP